MTKVKAESKRKDSVKPKAEAAPQVATKPEVVEETSEAVTEAKDFNLQQIEVAESAMESLFEFNASAYKSSEAVTQKVYENYVSNVDEAFSGLKALADTTDAVEFYKVAADNTTASAERMMEQFTAVAELTTQAMLDTRSASYTACAKIVQ